MYICVCVFLRIILWVIQPLQPYLLTSHLSTGSPKTYMRLSKSSRIKQSNFLLMANTNLVRIKTRLGLCSIGLAQSHMVFMTSSISVEESPRQMSNMYLKHLKFTSSQHSLCSRAGINLVDSTLNSSFKSQMDFMLKLKDIANDCSFTNSDEVVKFLFLTHNQNTRVKNALLDKMKGTSTLTEWTVLSK